MIAAFVTVLLVLFLSGVVQSLYLGLLQQEELDHIYTGLVKLIYS